MLTMDNLKALLEGMSDAQFDLHEFNERHKTTLVYIKTLIDSERLNEAVIEPLTIHPHETLIEGPAVSKVISITSLQEAEDKLVTGYVLIVNMLQHQWLAVQLENPLSRAIEQSVTETIIYGAKDSFDEQLEHNITMIRRRLPLAALKTEKFIVGSLSKTEVVLMYIKGLTNPEFISIAREKINAIDYDMFLDSSQIAAFIEDHKYTVFPQFLETDRPDQCVYSLGLGKLVILVGNTPYVLIAPITFFHLFQSPEDYFLRWNVASFFRVIRYLSFFLSIFLIPFYVALSTHHYEMFPLQILYVMMESRSRLPFTPFWEAFIMLITLEIIKEASMRMPSKSGQILGVIGGIVIGQATVAAGLVSKVLIVLVGISAIASYLVPNYLMTKSSTLIQFLFLVMASSMGIYGLILGLTCLLAHLNGLSSLKQPFFSPVSPFYGREWLDLFIRAPLSWMKDRPASLLPLQKWRTSRKR
ncbi:spore germination protein [Paenibacillus sepulcri]|uniref:Spore germination protein n=1 Tax=Paenibacillus sepulcri TaxID=359917 RepID=A0ABS7C2K6_9BACL|nr:spore germination protein [Paenibacillus sepulcri]